MQRAARLVLRPRLVGGGGRFQRLLLFQRHEGVELRLPFPDPLQTGLDHFARRHALVGERLDNRGKRQQSRCAAHLVTLVFCTTRKVAGSRSNGSVPAIGARPSKAGPMELAILSATLLSTGSPVTSAIALISFPVGLVMPRSLP